MALWLHAHVILHAELHDLNAKRKALTAKQNPGKRPVPENGSARFSLSAQDLASVANGALMAAGGAAVAWLATNWLPKIDQSTSSGILLAAVANTVINFLRKLLSDNLEY